MCAKFIIIAFEQLFFIPSFEDAHEPASCSQKRERCAYKNNFLVEIIPYFMWKKNWSGSGLDYNMFHIKDYGKLRVARD